jgi:REP element-mobilizing transposase RayT/DNA-binding transcriptional regulator GbsR (MarR family)
LSIFSDDADRRYFLDQLSQSIKKNNYLCYGWALMSNHFHVIVRCSDHPLDCFMRGLNSKYARYFNKRHNRRGYLFQDRFKSIISQDQQYLEELIRYVHLNPLRAGLCKDLKALDTYPWCGHSVLMGVHKNFFQTTNDVLRFFGPTPKARIQYRRFIEKGIGTIEDQWIVERVKESNRGMAEKEHPGCWVIGNREYVISVMKKNEDRIKICTVMRAKWPIEKVFKEIGKENKIKIGDLKKRSRMSIASKSKKIGAYVCCRIIGYSMEEVAQYLQMSNPAVSWAVKKAEEIVVKSDFNKFINLSPG